MISSIYSDLNLMVKQMLAEFDGRTTPIKLVRASSAAVSTVTGQFVQGALTNINLVGVVSPFKQNQKSEVDIEQGDLLLILDSQQEPLASDQVVIDSRYYSIVAIERIKPSDVVLLYKVQIRQ